MTFCSILAVGPGVHSTRLQTYLPQNRPTCPKIYPPASLCLLDWRDRLVDEGIHLVSAYQLAGFRHVVGTLWEVSDKYCVDAAKFFYETLRGESMTVVAVCRGLHRATRALRDGDNEMRRVTGESGTARKTDIHHYAMETVRWMTVALGQCRRMAFSLTRPTTTVSDTGCACDGDLVDGRSTCEERDAILLGDTTQETTGEATVPGSVYPFRYLVYSLLLHPNAGMNWFVDAFNF
jgi:hypothetical protein